MTNMDTPQTSTHCNRNIVCPTRCCVVSVQPSSGGYCTAQVTSRWKLPYWPSMLRLQVVNLKCSIWPLQRGWHHHGVGGAQLGLPQDAGWAPLGGDWPGRASIRPHGPQHESVCLALLQYAMLLTFLAVCSTADFLGLAD